MIGGISSCISICIDPTATPNNDNELLVKEDDNVEENKCLNSSSRSSIGENSSSGNPSTLTTCCDEEGSADMEVQSSFKGPLDTLSLLENSLPIKRGISKFFTGKSRSFTSLSDAISIKDLSKPDNPYNKRRRNLLVSGNNWDRNRFCPTGNTSAGISKKAIRSSKSTLALAVSMSNMEGYENQLRLPPLPPLPPHAKFKSTGAPPTSFSMRSFSLTDLQGIGSQPDFAKILR